MIKLGKSKGNKVLIAAVVGFLAHSKFSTLRKSTLSEECEDKIVDAYGTTLIFHVFVGHVKKRKIIKT